MKLKYSVIVADPPWNISKIKRRVRPNQKEMDYKLMSYDDIKNIPVSEIADDNSIIFLWVIDKFLHKSIPIIESWGFKYHLTMSWDKTNGISLYGFNRRTEFVVVGLRGKHEAYPSRKTVLTSFTAKSPYHSAKPDEFYNMLDVLPGKKIDLFARKDRVGWDVWGDEVESDIVMTGDIIKIKVTQKEVLNR